MEVKAEIDRQGLLVEIWFEEALELPLWPVRRRKWSKRKTRLSPKALKVTA